MSTHDGNRWPAKWFYPPKIIGWGLHAHLLTKNCVQCAPTSNKVFSISLKVCTLTQHLFTQHLFVNIVLIIHIVFYVAVDHQREDQMGVYENKMVCPSVRNWTKSKVLKLLYGDAEPFLFFLDNYATVMVCGARSMTKYYKHHIGNTLLDRLTPSDIAYSVLVYENLYEMWKEEILKCETCQTDTAHGWCCARHGWCCAGL